MYAEVNRQKPGFFDMTFVSGKYILIVNTSCFNLVFLDLRFKPNWSKLAFFILDSSTSPKCWTIVFQMISMNCTENWKCWSWITLDYRQQLRLILSLLWTAILIYQADLGNLKNAREVLKLAQPLQLRPKHGHDQDLISQIDWWRQIWAFRVQRFHL